MTRLARLLLVLATPGLVAAATERRTIPPGYHGDWRQQAAERCAPGAGDVNNIRITASAIKEFEMRTDVRAVHATGENAILVSGRKTHGADRYDDAQRMALLEGGTVLSFGEGEDHALYVRCKR